MVGCFVGVVWVVEVVGGCLRLDLLIWGLFDGRMFCWLFGVVFGDLRFISFDGNMLEVVFVDLGY